MALAFLSRLKAGLAKTTRAIGETLGRIASLGGRPGRDTFQLIEEMLVSADVGVKTSFKLREELEIALRRGDVKGKEAAALLGALRGELKRLMPRRASEPVWAPEPPTVVMVVGVNGTGKTTSVGKLAKFFGEDGTRRVILAAADTYRAAAVEQLTIWAERAGVEIIKHGHGGDPGAVVHDAAEAALARKADVLLVDTAGRLHTREDLMRELGKIRRVVARKIPGAPHEVLLVLDATTGQNAVTQAERFSESVGVTGLFLAKLDGTAKGGVVVAVWNGIRVPVKYVGVGEGIDDMLPFDPEEFVNALLPEELAREPA